MDRSVRTNCVLGTSAMGAGIVQVACRAGYRGVARDRPVEALGRAQLYVRDGLDRLARKGVAPEDDARIAGPKKEVFGS